MKVSELIEELQKFPEDAEVLTSSEGGCVIGDIEEVRFDEPKQGMAIPRGMHVLICDY